MPDGQSGVLENWDSGVDAVSLPLVGPIAAPPQFERPSYVLENWKWGSSLAGSPGGTIRWAIIGPNTVYPSQEYTAAATPIDPVFHASIRAAFDRWEQVGNFDFVESYSGLADIVVIWDELSGQSPSTIGLANTYYSGSQAAHSYISFDIGRRYRLLDGSVQTVGTPQNASTINLYTLALHEIGHALGLDHEDDLPTIMNSYDNAAITDLTADEIAGIEVIYGAKGSVIADDYTASTATTGAVNVGGSATGRIEAPGDSDWFRVSLTAGVQYRIDVVGGTLADPYVALLNAGGSSIAIDDDSGTGLNARITITPTTTGTYYISARSAVATGTGTYTVSLTQTSAADDYAGSTATTGTVAVGGTATGNLETGNDSDWFRVTLTAGATYQIDVRGSASAGGTLSDPYLNLRNSSGTSLAADNDSGTGLDARLSYTATSSGTYYISASSLSANSGTYTVAITQTAAADDYPASTATTGSVAVGGTQTGNIETTSDRDWIRVTLTAGQRYDITMRGAAAGGGTLTNPLFYLRDSSGGLITSGTNPSGGMSSLSYAATTTGAYYIEAAGYQNVGTGTYTVGVVQQIATDDYAASSATTAVVAVGGTQAGDIETATDRDWFRVTLTAGQTYTINVRAGPAGGGTLASPFALLKDAGGATVATGSNPSGGNSSLTYTATTTGNYYIEAGAYQNAGTGTYTVEVAGVSVAGPVQPGADDTTLTPLTLAPNGSATGSITPLGDKDWYRIALIGGVNYYSFRLEGNTLRDPYLRLLDSSGNGIAVDDDGGSGLDSLIVYTVPTTGIYYLEASSATILAGQTGSYVISASTFVRTDDYAASGQTTGSIAVGGSVTGNIEQAGDSDWLRITLTAGQAYRFEIGGATSSRGTLTAPLMRLFGANGYVASSASTAAGVWADGVFTYIPTESGTYYVTASAASGNESGTYTVSVSSLAIDDHAGNVATTSTIAVGGTASGTIESANDRDWFRVTLTAGQTYTASVRGGTLTSPSVAIYGSDGALAASDPTPDGQMTFMPTTTGAYYIQAASTSAAATGAYTLSLAAGDDYAASAATSGLVQVGQTVTGSIETAGDIDWISVNLTAGTLYRFDGRGAGSAGGTLADPTLSLLNTSGTVLGSDNDSGAGADSRILFTPTASGTYYLAIRSTSSAASGTYTIAATANPDDYAASTATTGSVTVGGTAEGVIEAPGNRDWFRATLVAGTTYTARVAGTATGAALRWTESSVILRDNAGNQITSATSSGLGASASLTFTAASSGTYYLDTLAYSTGVGSYSVFLATGGAQMTAASEITDQARLSETDLAALTAPPAIALDAPPLQIARSTTVLVEDPLSAILTPPPSDLFSPPAEQQNSFLANTSFDPLFQQQFSNTYTLLPF
jgi:hypothetical protein